MKSENEKRIKVLPDGPYQVAGSVPLNQLAFEYNRKGASVGYKLIQTYKTDETYYLCRCGKSNDKPFCDGSHQNGFDGTETAEHKTYEEMAGVQAGEFVDLMDAEELCAVARYCDTYGSTWNLVESINPDTVKIAEQQCANCPSGRLTIRTKDGRMLEPELPEEISVLDDPAATVHGPVWVKGGIPVEDAKGRIYPVRNRVTLCRCGLSQNKPFCDAQHMRNEGELEE